MANKSSLDNILKSVLSVGNSEQNSSFPPNIFSAQFNTVTSLLIDALVKTYPVNFDILRPFLKSEKISVKDGYVELPEQYRNIIGASINAKETKDGECSDSDPVIIDTEQEFKVASLKKGCKSRPIVFVSEKQWDYLTTSTYDFPTYWNPIGCFFGADKFKVCPYDLGKVELRYVRKEKLVKYGYINQPDDTFLFDEKTSDDSEWQDNAFSLLFSAMVSLYGAYTRDQTITDWSLILHKEGIL